METNSSNSSFESRIDKEVDRFVGCVVRLMGLSLESLNGSTGIIYEPPDPCTGRYTVLLKSPESAVSAHPNGVKVKSKNIAVISKNNDDFQINTNNNWTWNLSPSDQIEWLVDCYRMRVNDDCKDGTFRGIYRPGCNAWSVWSDFLIFCKLVALQHILPVNIEWNWSSFLICASLRLHQSFDKSDAKTKYGSENVFNVHMGQGRSLRYTALKVMESTSLCHVDDIIRTIEELFTKYTIEVDDNINILQIQVWINDNTSRFHNNNINIFSDFFQNIGGIKEWKKLHEALICTIDEGCANSGCKSKGLLYCGACKKFRYCGADCQKQHWVSAHKYDCLGTKKSELKPLAEVMKYIEQHKAKCLQLFCSERFDESVAASMKLLSYATIQYGEAISGVDFRRRGSAFLANIHVDMDLAKINMLIGKSYISMETSKGTSKAEPYLSKARDLIIPWRQNLQRQLLSIESDDKWRLLSVIFEFNSTSLLQFEKEKRFKDGRECIVETYQLLQQYKSVAPPVSHKHGDFIVNIARSLTELGFCAAKFIREEASRIADSEDDPLFVFVEKLLRYSLTTFETKFGKEHLETNQCARVTLDVLLEFPIVASNTSDLFEEMLLDIGKRVLKVSTHLDGCDSVEAGKAHYGLLHCYDRCCKVLFKRGKHNVSGYKIKMSNFVKFEKEHALEVQRIYTHHFGSQHPMVQNCNVNDIESWLK